MSAPPTVVVLVALDTKGEEAAFLRERVAAEGVRPVMVDIGVLGPAPFAADVTSERVAELGGTTLARLRETRDRAGAVDAMARGAARLVRDLVDRGEADGVLSIGGSGGTTVGTAAMRGLPLGVPKVMVSTLVAGDVGAYVGDKDLCMMHSVVDFGGLNPISERVLGNAAAAVCGMARAARAGARPDADPRPLVAASMFGVTTACVEEAGALLRAAGIALVPFHATGAGGRTMETLIGEGVFAGVLDLTTTEWADEVVGGTLSAGPTRLEAAGRAGLPQVVAPGALDMVNFVGAGSFPERFEGRTVHRHNRDVVLMRTTPEECREIGRRVADKLNASRGPVALMLPTRGVSALDAEGGPFFDPEADETLFASLERHCRPPVEVRRLDLHINDPDFARACCRRLIELLESADRAAAPR